MKYFVYDPIDSDFIWFKTAEEAKADCEKRFDDYRHEAQGDGWHEEIEGLCWGEVKECGTKTREEFAPTDRPLTEDERAEFGEFDSLIDFELLPVK